MPPRARGPRRPTPPVQTVARRAPAPPAKNWAAAILWGVGGGRASPPCGSGPADPPGSRALVLGAGMVVWLVVVFFFFQSVAPLLPASY